MYNNEPIHEAVASSDSIVAGNDPLHDEVAVADRSTTVASLGQNTSCEVEIDSDGHIHITIAKYGLMALITAVLTFLVTFFSTKSADNKTQ